MAFFPFMIQLDNVNCLVVGGGKVAYRKVELLHSFGAKLTVIAKEICDNIKIMAEANDNIVVYEREVFEADLLNMEVVVMATNDSELNSRYAKLCKEKRILVNVVDVKKDCGFYFPAIIKQDEVVISVSTGGSSPLLASRIKSDIKESLRDDYGEIAKELEAIRTKIIEENDTEAKRLECFKKELNNRLS